jgi:hypothetical protein
MSIVAVSPLVLVGRWSTRSQEQARRNAMTACTVLTARRLERIEVEAFISERLADRSDATATDPAARMVGVG